MKKQFLSKISFITVLLLMACSDSLLDKSNPNGGTPGSYYANENQLTAGVNAIYASIQSYNLMGREWFFTNDLRSDEMMAGGGQLEAPRLALLIGTNNPTNAVAQSVYTGLAQTVLRANEVIDGSVNTKNSTNLNRLVAEAKFLRAWSYYEWVTLWGGVPLITKVPTSLGEASQPRATVDDIYTFLIAELSAIQADLPLSYTGANVGRVTKGAAQALLGRVYMTRGNAGDYALAKTELLKVVSSGTYSLMSEYFDNFKEETPFNAESIFEIGYAGSNFNWNGTGDDNGSNNEAISRTQEYSAIAWRNLVPAVNLLNAYESTTATIPDAKTDPRFAANFYAKGDYYNNNTGRINYKTAGGSFVGTPATLTVFDDADVQGNTVNYQGVVQKISWKKYTALYKNNATFYTGAMNMRVIRYAEVLVNLAECEQVLGNLAAAVGYLNQIRARASVAMPALPTAKWPTGTAAEVFKAIQHEKQVEFAGEQLRNKDILRWRKQGKLSPEVIPYFVANKYELLPIPQVEFSTNSKLKSTDQNPGY